jgi:NADH:ubiquinone oxidoreductase subunit K
MLNWLVFFNASFWLCFFGFLIIPTNFFSLILLSELIWILLYVLSAIVGTIIDDLTCFSITFFILGFASIELCFGLLLLVVIKQLKLSINLSQNNKLVGPKTFERLLGYHRTKKKI